MNVSQAAAIKESETGQILTRFEDLINGFENTIRDLECRLVPISNPALPENTTKDPTKDPKVEKARPPLFSNLHEFSNRLEYQLEVLRSVMNRINL